MSNQLTGKAPRQPPIKHDAEITRKLSTVYIAHAGKGPEALGVLLGRDRIAIPKSCWNKDIQMLAQVACFDGEGKPLLTSIVFLEDLIPEEERLYLAKGIVEVKLDKEVPELCWPRKEKRYTECANANQMEPGNRVFAISVDRERKDTIQKDYTLGDVKTNKYVKVKERAAFQNLVYVFVDGEPLFHDEKIAGMFVPGISEKDGSYAEDIRYIMFRKQSIGQSSRCVAHGQ